MGNSDKKARLGLEIERKFLVGDLSFKKEATQVLHLCQGYICKESGRTVRVRISDEKGYLTIKGPSKEGLSRLEWEKELSLDEARSLMSLCVTPLVEKHRYIIPAPGGRKWEVDEFHGRNSGLIEAEIELGSPDESFERPSWLGEEVTGDKRYYNSMLSVHPYDEWKD